MTDRTQQVRDALLDVPGVGCLLTKVCGRLCEHSYRSEHDCAELILIYIDRNAHDPYAIKLESLRQSALQMIS